MLAPGHQTPLGDREGQGQGRTGTDRDRTRTRQGRTGDAEGGSKGGNRSESWGIPKYQDSKNNFRKDSEDEALIFALIGGNVIMASALCLGFSPSCYFGM